MSSLCERKVERIFQITQNWTLPEFQKGLRTGTGFAIDHEQ